MSPSKCQLLLVSVFLFASFSLAVTDPAEVTALISLYNSTLGPQWTPNQWNINTDPCDTQWWGVLCNGQHVYSISLQNNNLQVYPSTGTLPDNLDAFSNLQFFYLSANQIGGTVPAQIGNIKSLQQIGFDSNQLTGTIPETFSNLAVVQNFYFQNNLLTGSLDVLANLKNVQYMYVSNNRFTGELSPQFTTLPLLQQFGVDSNQLSGSVPTGFGNYQAVFQAFYGQNNLFNGTFSSSFSLCSKPSATCDLSNNDFSCPVPNPICCSVTNCVY